jgi:DNA-binding CsgD family transcriptional regulator
LNEPLAYLAAVAGDEDECRRITNAALAGAAGADPAWHVPWVYAALGLLELGHGRAESALTWLAPLAAGRARFHIPATRSTPDLVEAAVRAGRPEVATEAFDQYRRWADHARQPWIDAVVLRCQALLGPDESAGESYGAAMSAYRLLNRPFDEARAALLYGEWLRRTRRPAEARTHLSAALEGFEKLGAVPWAARARVELGATGTTAPQRPTGLAARLTPQELQIVRLAARGLSNKDIAAQLFLSARTVGYHLYKAYPKLGVASRAELVDLELTKAAMDS